ncbi:hypothetical protein CFC21_097875 [Triticum aestivum]|uniref:Uncharacterized protein n=3 Tax=Triticum TaxID=4564 RepID=A0A9R0ZC01_TRITD|nr:hypothetical protein CFC21_097875 [Triticum aestivum]VAI75161.1 unnamed protein product [Triticum turgidum subsp. durum]
MAVDLAVAPVPLSDLDLAEFDRVTAFKHDVRVMLAEQPPWSPSTAAISACAATAGAGDLERLVDRPCGGEVRNDNGVASHKFVRLVAKRIKIIKLPTILSMAMVCKTALRSVNVIVAKSKFHNAKNKKTKTATLYNKNDNTVRNKP